MTKVTCTYNISNFNFSLITKHPINDDVIIKQLVEDGYFSTFQCPDDLSYLLNKFTINQINTTLSTLSTLHNDFTELSDPYVQPILQAVLTCTVGIPSQSTVFRLLYILTGIFQKNYPCRQSGHQQFCGHDVHRIIKTKNLWLLLLQPQANITILNV